MANITASMVKELREMTGAGMMECKKALAEADGDMAKKRRMLKALAERGYQSLPLYLSRQGLRVWSSPG